MSDPRYFGLCWPPGLRTLDWPMPSLGVLDLANMFDSCLLGSGKHVIHTLCNNPNFQNQHIKYKKGKNMVKIYFILFFGELIQSLLKFLQNFGKVSHFSERSQVIDKLLVHIHYSLPIHIPIILSLKL